MSYLFNWLNKKAELACYSNSERPHRCHILITCIHSCELLQLCFHFLLRIISINYKTERKEFFRNCDSVTLSGKFSSAMENEYSFLHIQESDDEHHSAKLQAMPRFLKFYVMYVSTMWICHPQATCVCCTYLAEVQRGSFTCNRKPRHAVVRGNQDSAAQNASVTENVTANGFIVQIKLLKTC